MDRIYSVHIRPDEETKDDKLRRQVNELMSYCIILNKRDLNAVKFKSMVLEESGKEDLDAYELMDVFCDLDKSKKIDIVDKCSSEHPNIPNFGELLQFGEEKDLLDTYAYKPELTESEIRKRIKHCKNPMERQNLQRELSNMNFMSGKHRRGRKR